MNRIAVVLALTYLLQACGDSATHKPPPSSAPTTPTAPTAQTPAPEPMKGGTEKLFHNPFDADAVYLLSQKTGTPDALSVLVKRVSQTGVQYSRWLFNCADQTAQNLGVADSIQALDYAANSIPSKSQHYELKSKIGAIADTVCR